MSTELGEVIDADEYAQWCAEHDPVLTDDELMELEHSACALTR